MRLTGSGLGCPTWPRCTDDSLVRTPSSPSTALIEFGNRMLTFVLAAAAIADRRRGAAARPGATCARSPSLGFLGIPAQALLGGITVLTGLNPWAVAAHFLLSMALVAVATTLWLRPREPGVGPPLVRRPFRLLRRRRSPAVTAAVLVSARS